MDARMERHSMSRDILVALNEGGVRVATATIELAEGE
jgi:hypothetical protein